MKELAPHAKTLENWELGYTLPVPLPQLFQEQNGAWQIDAARVNQLARTVRDSERPVVGVPVCDPFRIARAPRADSGGRPGATRPRPAKAPCPLARITASRCTTGTLQTVRPRLNLRRRQAAAAMVNALCALEPQHRSKIRAVTLLGEVHHYFPDFERGMGFGSPYRVTDYSPASRAGSWDFCAPVSTPWRR